MQPSTDGSTLVVFCRRPAPGVGKQRIAAELGQQAGWEVGELLLETALEDARNWAGSVVLSTAAAADSAWASALLPNAHVVPQPPGNLGHNRFAPVNCHGVEGADCFDDSTFKFFCHAGIITQAGKRPLNFPRNSKFPGKCRDELWLKISLRLINGIWHRAKIALHFYQLNYFAACRKQRLRRFKRF